MDVQNITITFYYVDDNKLITFNYTEFEKLDLFIMCSIVNKEIFSLQNLANHIYIQHYLCNNKATFVHKLEKIRNEHKKVLIFFPLWRMNNKT